MRNASVAAVVISVISMIITAYNIGAASVQTYLDSCQILYEAESEQTTFWREMYRKADADSKFVNCLELDDNYFVCEKVAHAQR